ncbi:hypothetical protein llap_10851 [Limosa lapponica baueri]|uniref:Uncharacterized protein n=1 Tax=Limosa lapponica baueri TaxID=1758121 RepID=A0A2I0TYJ1_LIMLA|nr:hypothetical protein llap_10851 [Limosa lapponica baueri]
MSVSLSLSGEPVGFETKSEAVVSSPERWMLPCAVLMPNRLSAKQCKREQVLIREVSTFNSVIDGVQFLVLRLVDSNLSFDKCESVCCVFLHVDADSLRCEFLEEECQHNYEVKSFLCLPQHLDARIRRLETGTCLLPNCFLGQDEAKEELSDALESQ